MNDKKEYSKINLSHYLIKIDRISAWILLVVIILYGITGYGMTKGLINPVFATTLHLEWLGFIGLIVFVIHTAWAIHLFFKRHQAWNLLSKIVLISFYVVLISFFVWIHFFYQTNNNKNTNNTNSDIISTTIFTAQTLKQYDGKNGRPAYVAVDGMIYDMSNVFRSGQHYGYSAGQDLSNVFHQEHPDNYLNNYAIVGSYQK